MKTFKCLDWSEIIADVQNVVLCKGYLPVFLHITCISCIEEHTMSDVFSGSILSKLSYVQDAYL